MEYARKNATAITFLGIMIWLLAGSFFLYEFFLRTFLGTVIHELSHSLHANIEHLTLIDAAYCLTYGLMQIPVGILVDRYGARITLTTGALICTMGVFIFALANSIYIAILARMIMGVGSAFAFVCLLTFTLSWLPKRFSGLFFGLAQLLGAIGPMLAGAPLVLMLYKFHDNWHMVIAVIGVIGLMLTLLIALFVRNNPNVAKTIRLTQQLSLLFKDTQAWKIVIYTATVYFSLALLGTLWGTTYLETRGFSHTHAALITSTMWFGLAFGCPLAGAISDLIKRRKPLLVAASGLGIIISTTILVTPYNSSSLFITLFFLLGIASSGQSIAFNVIAEHARPTLRATALGFNNAIIGLANAALIPLTGLIIQASFHGHYLTSNPAFHRGNFTLGLSSMPMVYLIALLLAIFGIKETYHKFR